jgi:hypothetical protein
MPDDTIKSLRVALDNSNSDMKALKEKVEKAEVWLKALFAVAIVFGIAGGIGWSMLDKARDQLSALQGGVRQAKDDLGEFATVKRREIAAEAATAVASAVNSNEVVARLTRIEARVSQIGTAAGPADSGQPIGQIRHNMVAACPSGQVAKGVKLNLGGTCNSHCNGDGQPVSQLELNCVKQ